MGGNRNKSALERYLDGLIIWLEIQKLKRPEEWVRSLTFVPAVLAITSGYWLLGAVLFIVCVGVMGFLRTKAGGSAWTRTLRESMPRVARKAIRNGSFDGKVGGEVRAILDRCVATANQITADHVEMLMFAGLSRAEKKSQLPVGRSMEQLMLNAFGALRRPLLLNAPLEEEELGQLREVEASLQTLRVESLSLRRGSLKPETLPDEVTTHLEEIKALEELN